MNKITATGRLAADCEVRFTTKGDPIANFRLASDIGYGDSKSTNWFACTIFGKRGEAVAPHLTKGTAVTVFGSLTLREWTNKENVKQISPDIRVDEIVLQGGKQQEEAQKGRPASKSAPQSGGAKFSDMDDDIPFRQHYYGKYSHIA